MPQMKGRNILTLAEFSREEIIKILDLADRFKEERKKFTYISRILERRDNQNT